MPRLLIIGSTCVDVIINVGTLPKTGDDLEPKGQTFTVGGCGWNVFRAARLTGADPVFLSPVGTGVFGDMVARTFAEWGVPVLARCREENGCCYCLVETGGERTFLSVHGGEYLIRRKWLDALEGEYSLAYVCGMELQEPTGPELIGWLEDHREVEVFYAPGTRGVMMDKARQERVLDLKPIMHLNVTEATALTGETDPLIAGKAIHHRTGNTVVITLGAEGCLCLTKTGELLQVPAVPVTVADTIGAGDTHAGVLLGCIHQGMDMEQALTLANAASAETVRRPGADIPKTLGGITDGTV